MFLTSLPCTSLSDTGELYVWGRNKHGQLASRAVFLPLPQRIEAHYFQDEKVTAVWSGWTHLVAKTGEGATESLGLVRVAVHSLGLGVEDSGRGGRTLSTGKWRTWHPLCHRIPALHLEMHGCIGDLIPPRSP
jgi:hypothetical protein